MPHVLGRSCSLVAIACALLIRGSANGQDPAQPATPDATATPADAAGQPQPGPVPGHSYHGEAFNDGPRQRAYLMGGTGDVSFAITCQAPDGQAFFNQGIGQLHGFWYFEAERSFRQVAALDPECAMAYCGMAMANVNNENRAKGFIAKAVEKKATASAREALWIDAYNAYFNHGDKDQKARRRQLVRDLEGIVYAHPDDIEAKAFLCCQIWANSSHDLPINSHLAIDTLIGDILAANPAHPVHHYRIHLWDYEKADRALHAASLCGQSAPTIAHMWHMPGHIFSRLERYSDAAWQQEASARADHAQMIRDHVLPDQIHNYAHNNEWLIRDLMYVGRVRDGLALAKNMLEMPRHPKFNQITGGGSAPLGRARLFDVLLGYELWDELLALSDTMYLEPTDAQEQQIKRLRAIGTAAFGKGDGALGQTQIAALDAMLATEKTAQDKAGADAETKAKEESKPDDQVAKAKADAIQGHAGKLVPIETALAELRGHVAAAAGDFAAAREQFQKANQAKEFLSRFELAAGDQAKAEQLAREAVDGGKNQVVPLANYAYILHRLGKSSDAAKAFEQLRALSSEIDDLNVPVFARLKPLVAELGQPEDWRIPATTSEDAGARPDLASLGPFRWRPSPAPDWTATAPDGSAVGYKDFHGRPVVAIYYLGFGCVHCVEQLKAFGPLTQQYAELGISLVAISSDSTDALKNSLDAGGADGQPLPFPILSDPEFAAFKSYRAFDDFENVPLHGTFLIDASGLIRWQDISFEPFKDAAFLLAESKRLLSQPVEIPHDCETGDTVPPAALHDPRP